MQQRYAFLFLVLIVSGCEADAQYLHQNLHVSINHNSNEITVCDTLKFPSGSLAGKKTIVFTLCSSLVLEDMGKGSGIEKLENAQSKTSRYLIKVMPDDLNSTELILRYSGSIRDEIETGAAEYARGFSETNGTIGPEGIYLAGSSNWVPSFEMADLFTFDLTVEVDEPWGVVSQGNRTINRASGKRRIVKYHSPDPMNEIFLIAGQWTEYSSQSDNVLVQAFLRSPDQALAQRYLGVTSHYLELYTRLIGEYPFTKFTLVENFWETGYGMPSFTLLGEKVIRFPWILHSSYPHELLHNYWGNSVYVDYEQGNWCEGITAYMADHLIKEQRGGGIEYRRNTLQKYTDYVNEENDFPASEFLSRNNPAEEAIGYGKVMMFNHMLRKEFGDELFLKAWTNFYNTWRFRFASFNDIQHSFEEVTRKELGPLFEQWIQRTGAPSLEISDVKTFREGDQYELSFNLKQVQPGEPFQLSVPIAIYLEGLEEIYFSCEPLATGSTACFFSFKNRPLKISVDPQFDMMRILDRSEVPSTLSQLFGAKKAAIILPSTCALYEEYLALARMWSSAQEAQEKELSILLDSEIDQIPSDRPVWILDSCNRFYPQVEINDQYREMLTEDERVKMKSLIEENSLVYAIPNSNKQEQTLGFIGSKNPTAITGLSRKLFHYGSYGYLGFEGDAPDNVLKGIFPALNSRLDHVIAYPDQPAITQQLTSARSLADSP
ncbi:MAG: M1 family metallopeptidase [Bacteroidetes bacterium]|nr:M1 family metallopeptidase [Bacteroidota bacterium]